MIFQTDFLSFDSLSTNQTSLALAPRRRTANKALRRQQLIEATIDSIAKRGFAETTLARVADGAGLSRGIVNFHFTSKTKLLVATLEYLAEEYRSSWTQALERAGPRPADSLAALIDIDFHPAVCSRKKVAVWFAYWGEAKSRPTYLELCGALDAAQSEVVHNLSRQIARDGGYEATDPDLVADGLRAMSDGFWLELLLRPKGFDRQAARRACLAYLAAAFPRDFALDGSVRD